MSLFDDLFGSQASEATVDEQQEEPVAEESHSDEWEEQMTEAELRLQKASYYRILLDDHLFDDHSNPICAEIEKEMRQFVRTRLGVLLNLTSEKEPGTELFSTQEVSALKAVAASFNAQEIAVLKTLAAKIVSKPGLIGQAAVKPAEPPKPAPPLKPTLKKRSVPDKKPEKEVVQKPVVAQPVQQKPKKQPDKPVVKKPTEASFADGEIVKEGDRTYKIKWIEEHADYEPPPGVGKIVKNGHTYKVLKMDITKQTPADGYIPMPNIGQMARLTEMKANEVVANLPGTLAGLANIHRDRVEQ
jgi:hypothetical protein